MQEQQRSTPRNAANGGERDAGAPARLSDMNDFAKRLKSDPAGARNFFQAAGILGDDGKLAPAYRKSR